MNAVLWDLDGTLIDSEPVYAAATQDVLSAQGIVLDQSFLNRMIGQSLEALMVEFDRIYGLKISIDTFEKQMVTAFLNRKNEIKRLVTADLYLSLQDQAVPTAIVTNSERMIVDMNLTTTGLNLPSAVTVCRNDVKNAKPNPEPYLRAAYLLGIPPESCLVIEDSSAGAQAGIAAGMQVIGYNHSALEIDAKGAIFPDSITALTALIMEWVNTGRLV